MIADNCKEERDALKYTWPSVTAQLCIFHMFQQIWRWLTDKNHGVRLGDRIHNKFKEALFANSQELFEQLYSSLLSDKIVENYAKAMRYFNQLYVDREAFGLCFRSILLVRENRTNNFAESQFLVMKDIIPRTRNKMLQLYWIKLQWILRIISKLNYCQLQMVAMMGISEGGLWERGRQINVVANVIQHKMRMKE